LRVPPAAGRIGRRENPAAGKSGRTSPVERATLRPVSILPLLLAGACAADRHPAGGEAAFRRGHFAQAAKEYEEAARASPDDPALARAAASARRAAALEEARQLFLTGKAEAAVAILDPLAEEDRTDGIVAAWRSKVRRSLANGCVQQARDAFAGEDLPTAQLALERALAYFPGHEEATSGLEALEREAVRRGDLARGYYVAGMQALGEDRLEESKTGFEKTLKYDPGHRRAELRGHEVARRLAASRLAQARAFAKAGKFGAAHREASLARLLDPELEAATTLRDEMAREMEVAALASRAEFEFARGDAAAARATLEKALGRASRAERREALADRLRRLAEDELEGLYLQALRLEADRRVEPALEVYGELLARTPHYRDTISRVDNLRVVLSRVEKLYGEALAASESGNLQQARQHLDEIANLYPEYRDVVERRASLGSSGTGRAADGSARAPE
jgi:tetratricopeptide (TPR) repeat protein